jgi:endoglycosylceramidase
VLGILGLAPAAGAEAVTSRPRPDGRWLLDEQGRVRIDHGVNMVYKRPPYSADAAGFGEDDARFLARNGFTTVRLGLTWKAVEPRPGRYDDAYLARVRRTVRILHRHGIVALLDFHQDLFNEKFQGEGAPDWAVLDDGLPNQPRAGFPDNYFVNEALNRAFDNFWDDAPGPAGVGLVERYAAAWRHVARFMRGTPGVLGIDVFNEPWPGSLFERCLPAGCPVVDAKIQAMTQQVLRQVRAVDPRTPVFYEPDVLFNDGVPTYVRPTGRRLGFSFHDYCDTAVVGSALGPAGTTSCQVTDDRTWQNMEAQLRATGATPLLTEFGATTDRATLTGMVDRAARHRTGWMYWAYCGCEDPTTTGPGAEQALVLDPARPPRGRNVDHAKLRALAVPHPAEVAGTPSSYRFDRSTRVFTTAWTTARAAGPGRFGPGARTRIATPRVAYPHGYRVRVRGARVLSPPGAAWLVVAQRAGVRRVTLTVRPR